MYGGHPKITIILYNNVVRNLHIVLLVGTGVIAQ